MLLQGLGCSLGECERDPERRDCKFVATLQKNEKASLDSFSKELKVLKPVLSAPPSKCKEAISQEG